MTGSTATTWSLIHAERRALLDDVAPLEPEQWNARSLCSAWTVHQMLGHLVALATQTPPAFLAKMVRAGFRFDRMVDTDLARWTRGGPAATVAAFRAHLEDTTAPPGPVASWLGEIVVHGADIRRPLGLPYAPPTATTVQVADFYRNSNLIIGARRRIDGLRLVATDADWSTGSGPAVSGPILSLVLAMTGRADGLRELNGAGVTRLRERARS